MAEEVKLSLTLTGDASGAGEALEEVRAKAEEARAAVEGVSGADATPQVDLEPLSDAARKAREAEKP